MRPGHSPGSLRVRPGSAYREPGSPGGNLYSYCFNSIALHSLCSDKPPGSSSVSGAYFFSTNWLTHKVQGRDFGPAGQEGGRIRKPKVELAAALVIILSDRGHRAMAL